MGMMNPEQPSSTASEEITFSKVQNRESYLIYQGESIFGRVECPMDADSWRVIIDPDPGHVPARRQDGFKTSGKAREWARGFAAGSAWIINTSSYGHHR